MNNNSILIDHYLQNEMTAEEKLAFEQMLAGNPELQEELRIQQQVTSAAEKAGLKYEFSRAISKRTWTKNLIKWGIIGGAIAVAAFIFYAVKTNMFFGNSGEGEMPTGLYKINTVRDTIIETKDGIVFGIPANAFNTKSGTVDIEIKTALDPSDIIKQGLSTTSNGQLLNTAGMFYINATDSGKPLTLVKKVSVSVPAKKIDPNMQLFDGVVDSQGRVNWVDPKPLTRQLRTYDITTLDFYPPAYIPTVKALNKDYQNKRYTDSLYYSFSGYKGLMRDAPTSNPVKTEWTPGDTSMPNIDRSDYPDGKALFQANCASCHKLEESLTGPALKNIRATVPKGDWIYKFIHNSVALAESGDAEAKRRRDLYRGVMMTPFPQLSNVDIDAILDYADNNYDEVPNYETDPSRIKAIWDPKFNNTILATKEFEERVRYIHSICAREKPSFMMYGSPVNIYVANLDKPLYVSDEICAELFNGDQYNKFEEFAKRKDGGVVIADGLQTKLAEYFRQKYEVYRTAAEKTWAKFREDQNRLLNIASEKEGIHAVNDFKRTSKNYREEYCANLSDAYRQIGITKTCNDTLPPPEPAPDYYSTDIITLGWKNLDAYVIESTKDRQSMTYTDPSTGKVAKITYSEVSFNIENEAQFDQVLVYLIPDSLSSFQRVDKKGSSYKEQLNSLFKYDAVVLAYKGTQAYFYKETGIQPKAYTFSLAAVTDAEVKHALSKYEIGKSTELLSEFDYRAFEQQETIRRVQLKKDETFRETIAGAIFPCYGRERAALVPMPADTGRAKIN